MNQRNSGLLIDKKKIDDDSSSKKLLNALNTNMNIISGLTEKL